MDRPRHRTAKPRVRMEPLQGCLLGLILALAFAINTTATLSALAAPARKALVIGNARYVAVNPLRNAGADASAMALKLEALGFRVTLALDLDKEGFEKSVNAFAATLGGSEAALFYYAGHGLQVDGRNYMVPIDARADNEADLPFQLVALDVVLNRLASNRLTSIVILDACRDNPLGDRLAKALGERAAAVGKGLGSVKAAVGMLVSYSTQPGNAALDGDGDHSPFTQSLLTHIEVPNIDVLDTMKRVRRDVVAATRNEQVPWDNSSLINAFYFLRKAQPPVRMELAPKPPKPGGRTNHGNIFGPNGTKSASPDLSDVLPPDNISTVTTGRPPVGPCDLIAASATDPERVVPGGSIGALDAAAGIGACRQAVARYPNTPRFEFQLARSLHKGEQYAEAARLYRELVERGYLAALTNYGWLLDNGRGVRRDHAAAVRLHLLAAHQGDQFGMFNAAQSYDSGNGLPYNPAQAAQWIYAAVRLGHDYSIRRMSTDALGWTPAFRVEMQRLLKRAGLYGGPLDGVFGPDVHRAVRQLALVPIAPSPGGATPAKRFDPSIIPINAPARQ
ncbi:MAG: caspase family protein [Hyphomicrobiaceae bacterium]